MTGFVLLSLWPQQRLKSRWCHYQIWITVSTDTKIPQRAQHCLLWSPSERCTRLALMLRLCEQPEPSRSGGNHSRDRADPALVLRQAGPRDTLAATVTGTAECGQDSHSRDRSAQAWTPKYPLKLQDASQLLSKVTQSTMSAWQCVRANVLTLWIFKQLWPIPEYHTKRQQQDLSPLCSPTQGWQVIWDRSYSQTRILNPSFVPQVCSRAWWSQPEFS